MSPLALLRRSSVWLFVAWLLATSASLALAEADAAPPSQEAADAAASQEGQNPVLDFIHSRETTPESNQGASAAGPGKDPNLGVFTFPSSSSLDDLETLDEPTREAALAAIREYYDYRASGYRHRRAVFDWQLLSSKLLFFVVIALVAVGVYFSGVQFRAALASDSRRIAPDTSQDDSPPQSTFQTTLEASAKGLKISSPVLGLVILSLSLLFFYLYLTHVYPIGELW